jgi:hypothetical protein
VIQVHADHVGPAFEGAEAVATLTAARVEKPVTRADVKPLEIDRE